MKKVISCVIAIVLLLSGLCGCSENRQTKVCARCGMYVTPIYRVANSGEDFYLCGSCSVCSMEFGAFTYKIEGGCYFCNTETTCCLAAIFDRNNELDHYILVCDTCIAQKG